MTATKTVPLMPGCVGICGRRPSSPPALRNSDHSALYILHSAFGCPVGRAAQAVVRKTAQVSATLTRDSILRA